MMTIRKGSLIILSLLLPLALAGQKTDYGIWYEIRAEKKIWKGLRLDLETSIRTDQNASHIESFYVEPGLRYKFNDYFAAGLYYRFIEQEEKDDQYHPRNRYIAQVKGTLPEVFRFTLSARYRMQVQDKTYIDDIEDEEPLWAQRFRLDLDYDIRGIPLKPFVNVEAQRLLSVQTETTIDKWRYMIGLEYTLNKKHTFGLEYIYNESRVTKPAYMNLLGITYSIRL
jgi:long-subunit fatty acid transport protein